MPVRSRPRAVKSPISYLARPMRPVYSKFGHQSLVQVPEKSRKPRPRKTNGFNKYDMLKRSPSGPDYTDVAYREAVSKLRFLLNESYHPSSAPKYTHTHLKQEESDDESGVSIVVSDRTRVARLSPYRRPTMPPMPMPAMPHMPPMPGKPYGLSRAGPGPCGDHGDCGQPPAPPELLSFIERQEEYIEQLEKESQYCRDELSQLLGKVKDLIAENEALHDQQKTGVLKNVFEGPGLDDGLVGDFHGKDRLRKRLEGPLIVFESRISELEAQLTQGKIDLRKAQDETELYRRKMLDADPSAASTELYRQIEALQKEKRELSDALAKLQASVGQIREKELDAAKRVQRTLDVVDKTTFEKQQAEMEVYRLKSELEQQHDKLLEVLSDQTRKVSDERGQAERRYLSHVEQLSAELAMQRDMSTKVQLELEKHARVVEDLKRELMAKNATIDTVKKELASKIASLQSELTGAFTERDSLEQELSTSRMAGERSERINRQESARLQVEIAALRQRMDRTDAELMHSRRENLRLAEQIASQDKEITLYKIRVGEKDDLLNGSKERDRDESELMGRNHTDPKHVESVSGIEEMIESQGQEMALLKIECESLTRKLEESTALHKEEMANLQSSLDYLTSKLEPTFGSNAWPSAAAPQHHEPFIPEEQYPVEEYQQENIPYEGEQQQYDQQQYDGQAYGQDNDDTERLYVQEIPDTYEAQDPPQNFQVPEETFPTEQQEEYGTVEETRPQEYPEEPIQEYDPSAYQNFPDEAQQQYESSYPQSFDPERESYPVSQEPSKEPEYTQPSKSYQPPEPQKPIEQKTRTEESPKASQKANIQSKVQKTLPAVRLQQKSPQSKQK